MTKTKSTKRALLLSALSLLMCVSMLIGSTFAWFTDEVKTAGNIIQSGDLEVVLEKYTSTGYKDVENQVLNFKTSPDSTVDAEDILWEPGCTYQLETIRVRNAGNLALKFELALANVTGDTKLLEALEFTYTQYDPNDTNTIIALGAEFDCIKGELLPGETSGVIMINVHMKEDAGSEYENLKLENVGLIVTAQQLPHEYDSFNNQYDKLIEALNGALISGGSGSRTQIGVEIAQITGITSVDSFYVEIYDQNGDVMTKIVPTQKYIDSVVDGVVEAATACAVIVGDSGSWDNTAFVPTVDKYPVKATVFVNGVEKGSTTSFQYGGNVSSWDDVVAAYNDANP